MMKRIIGALILGLGGAAILVSLGLWQVRRLAWKEGILAEIAARIEAPAVALPAAPDPGRDEYLAVTAQGTLGTPVIRLLLGLQGAGPSCRIVAPFETGGRRVLVDRGIVPAERCKDAFAGGPVEVTGNLHWPDEVDSFTPAPEADWQQGGLWFARDVPAMAAALETEPVLIVARTDTGEGIQPLGVGTEGIRNEHLQYAVTWFGLALVWLGMTALLLWRMARRSPEKEHP